MRLLIVLLFVAVFTTALPYFGEIGNILPDVEWRAEEGSIAIRLTPDLAVSRKEVYLGERLWLAFQVKRPHAPCPLSITIRDLETGEVVMQRSTTANICGGQAGPGMFWTAIIPDFTVREPVREGRRYKIEIRAGTEYGAYTFVERHNPVGRITSVSIERGGRVVTRLAEGEEHVVKVTVQNQGEVDYVFNVTLYLNGVKVDSKRLTVITRRSAVAELKLTPKTYGTVNLTVAVGGVIITDRQSLDVEVVAPHPRFVVLEPREIEARVGSVFSGVVRIRNVGETCSSLHLSIDQPWDFVYTPRPVATGEVVEAAVRFTPALATQGVAKITARCGDVSQTLEVPYVVKARLRARAEAADGRPVPAKVTIEGVRADEEWLRPGRYVVVAPAEVAVGEGSRWRFVNWDDGERQPTREVNLDRNVDLVARYVLEHRVELSALGQSHVAWVESGRRVTPPFPKQIQLNATHRLVFQRWAGVGCGDSFEFLATSPAKCTAEYRREFKVVVSDPLGRFGVDTWSDYLTIRVPVEVNLGNGTRWVYVGSNCRYVSQAGYAVFEFRDAAVCRLEWRREYRVVLESGIPDRPVSWEGWLPQGGEVRLVRGGELKAEAGVLSLPEVVEGASVRYKLRGWSCGGETVALAGPVECVGVWDVEYRVKISIYLDGRLVEVKTFWASGDVTLDAEYYKPAPPIPLTSVKFEKWSFSTEPRAVAKVEGPSEFHVYWATDYAPLAATAIGGAAVAATAAYLVKKKRDRRRTIEVEVVGGEETKTR